MSKITSFLPAAGALESIGVTYISVTLWIFFTVKKNSSKYTHILKTSTSNKHSPNDTVKISVDTVLSISYMILTAI